MRRSEEFRRAVRQGRRASSATLVVHALKLCDGRPARVGFVVSKAVGNAVTRHRVKRRLRHAVRPRLPRLNSTLIVVRAMPRSAEADFSRLNVDLDSCLSTLEGARA